MLSKTFKKFLGSKTGKDWSALKPEPASPAPVKPKRKSTRKRKTS